MEWFFKTTGIAPSFGGYHLTQGTKNALVNLGNQCYLEILAADSTNEKITPPRWMGIDLIKNAQVTRWCLKSKDLEKDSEVLKNHQSTLGTIYGGQRKTSTGDLLAWEMILPLASPKVDLLPFMVDWSNSSVHPTDNLPSQCQLLAINFYHPKPKTLQPYFEELGVKHTIKKGNSSLIKLTLETQKGIIEV